MYVYGKRQNVTHYIFLMFSCLNDTYLGPRLRYFAGISLIEKQKFAEIDTMCVISLKSTISEKNEDVECIITRNFFLNFWHLCCYGYSCVNKRSNSGTIYIAIKCTCIA